MVAILSVGAGFRYDDHWRYAHMAMVERVYAPGGGDTHTMMAAWQAAPLVDPDMMGNMVMAVEGLKDQRILYRCAPIAEEHRLLDRLLCCMLLDFASTK